MAVFLKVRVFFQKHSVLINTLILDLETKTTFFFPQKLLENEINAIWMGIWQ